ncbi:MAG: hypothetical protein LW806_11610 [Planctomycetaceae bacterium]|nr:hypothetical protein [Planctomycetaceae bacterium]
MPLLDLNLEPQPAASSQLRFEAQAEVRSASLGSPLAAFYREAREAKCFARERLVFRLAKESGAQTSESGIPPIASPVAPVSASARAELGNPLGAFLLEALAQADASQRSDG